MPAYQQDWIQKWALYRPEQIAVRDHDTDRTLTYAQLNRLGNRLSHYLKDRFSVGKGDRIALLMENSLEHIPLFAAAQKLGCILAPFNFRLAPPEINYLLENAGPALVIYGPGYKATLDACPAMEDIDNRLAQTELREWCNPHQFLPEDETPVFHAVEEDDPIFILYTSGTTGFPKGALYTHKMLFWNSVNTAMSLIVNTESRTINCMPLFHTGGWNVLLTPLLHHGGYVCLMKKFDAATVLQLLESERPTLFMGVPTMLKMMADLSEFETADLSSLHYIIVGGESMPVPLIERWHARGVAVRQGYGLTEVGPNLTSLHQDDATRRKGSIGRPNFYVQIRIADSEGQPVPANRDGELLLGGPMVTPGYWRDRKATRKALRDGWFHTGDVVRQDDEGYLYVTDRIKNMYISGGENVYPAEVERVLLTHPAVGEAAVVGAPDDRWGETGKAFIVLKPFIETTEESILQFCSENLAKFKTPKQVVFLRELPKNDTGKIDRRKLQEG